MRSFLLCLFLLLPTASSAYYESPKFDTFLVKFRILYRNYHFGETWPKQKIDKEAARIWQGCHDYDIASILASQGVFETHYNIDPFVYGHRGHCGMRANTILVEAIRLGIIKKGDPDGTEWLLKICRKDPGYADYLAASRLAYLIKVCHGEERALRTWVRGPISHQNEVDRKDSLGYAKGVEKLKTIMFRSEK